MAHQRILFVDDDANLLAGLRNLLRRDRQRWDMAFALSGEAALALLAAGHFDIVVSDMRMPGMDGATLLNRIKELYPETTRIVLSGQADREGVERALPVTHQFLSKPCEGEALRAVLERTTSLRQLMVNETIQKIVGRVERLPSVPGIYWELVNATSRGDVGTAAIAAIVEREPAMTAKVLQLVNSAYYGLLTEITSIQQAVAYLGIEQVRDLTLTAHIFELPEDEGVDGTALDNLQRHSLVAGHLARRFSSGPKQAEQAFTAAILHDIGKMIFALGFHDAWSHIEPPVEDGPPRPHYVVERERFGVSHAEVGAYLLGIWGLPLHIVEAVAFHHEPGLAPSGEHELLAVVHAADVLARRGTGDPGAGELDHDFFQQHGWTARRVAWESSAAEYFRTLAPVRQSTRPPGPQVTITDAKGVS